MVIMAVVGSESRTSSGGSKSSPFRTLVNAACCTSGLSRKRVQKGSDFDSPVSPRFRPQLQTQSVTVPSCDLVSFVCCCLPSRGERSSSRSDLDDSRRLFTTHDDSMPMPLSNSVIMKMRRHRGALRTDMGTISQRRFCRQRNRHAVTLSPPTVSRSRYLHESSSIPACIDLLTGRILNFRIGKISRNLRSQK